MSEQQFEKLQIGSNVVLIVSGVEVQVSAIDEDDRAFMDHCGGWHHFSEADAPSYEF